MKDKGIASFEFGGAHAETLKLKKIHLKASDPGKLFSLLSALTDQNCITLERKINKYMMSATQADLAFFSHYSRSIAHDEIQIQVIGSHELHQVLRLPITQPFGSFLLKLDGLTYTENPARLDHDLQKVLKKELKKVGNKPLTTVVFMPFRSLGIFNNHSLYYILINSNVQVTELVTNKRKMEECFSYCNHMVANAFISDQETEHVKMCVDIVQSAVTAFSNVDDEQSLLLAIQHESNEVMKGAACKAYFIKPFEAMSLVLELEEDPQQELLPAAIGSHQIPQSTLLDMLIPSLQVQGVAMEEVEKPVLREHEVEKLTFKTDVQMCKKDNDPYKQIDFASKTLESSDIDSLVLFPTIYNGEENGFLKIGLKDVREDSTTKYHELAKCLGSINGLAIQAMWRIRRFRQKEMKLLETDCLLMRRARAYTGSIEQIVSCEDLHYYHCLLELRFNPLDVPQHHIACVIMGMFDELDLFRQLHIDECTFIRLILSLREAHGQLPYHNWHHSFGTAHFAFLLINNLSLLKQGILSDLEAFALLIATLAHAIDYRGCTSVFQLYAGDQMAALYTSAGAIQERLALSTLLRMITDPSVNIVSEMRLEDFQTLVHLLQMLMIESTLENHVDKMSEMYLLTYNKLDRSNAKNVKLLLSLCYTCADLSDYAKPWSQFMAAHDRQMTEFFRMSGYVEGVYDLDDMNVTSEMQVNLQVDFLKCVVIPTFENLYIFFPTVFDCCKRAKSHLATLEEILLNLKKNPDRTIADAIATS